MCYLKIKNTKSKLSKFVYLTPFSFLNRVRILRFYKERREFEIDIVNIKKGVIKCKQVA